MAADRGLHLEGVRWETDARPGFHSEGPQGLIDDELRLDDVDLVVAIFWKRFGTPVPDADSGTEHEIRNAYRHWQETGRPDIMAYFNQRPYAPRSKDETDQWGRVLAFQAAFPKQGLWWPYKGKTGFERLLRTHLAKWIRTRLSSSGAVAEGSAPPAPSADYFTIQRSIIEEASRLFVGRAHVESALDSFIRANRCGYFLISGGPGQGKTALACHLIRNRSCVHHIISRTGGRDDARLILRSLLAQIVPGAAEQAESISELTKLLDEALLGASLKSRPVAIVIAGLDELPDSATPPYLPTEHLPDGVFVVVTSRPGDHVDRLRQRLFAVPVELCALDPLDLDEMRTILTMLRLGASESDIERIAEASQGNPLYLRATADELTRNPEFSIRDLPSNIDGFFRRSTASLALGNTILGDVLALLSAARKPLSLAELSAITGSPNRAVFEGGIRPVRHFLLETNSGYTFYHAKFHEFVTRNIFYADELSLAHARIAEWLIAPSGRDFPYRYNSLAYHLAESGAADRLVDIVDEPFLAEKMRRFGYAVLEDIEYLVRALLARRDPAVIDRCVALVESLRRVAGGDFISEIARSVQPYRSGPPAYRAQTLEPDLPSFRGLDLYAAVLPRGQISADFFEVVPIEDRLAVAIGDAPSYGLKSTFVARFLASVFHDLVLDSKATDTGALLSAIDRTILGNEYLGQLSMQGLLIETANKVIHIANAGHPYPVHYSARRRKADILPMPGLLLNTSISGKPTPYEEFAIDFEPGDILVLVSDGLTEANIVDESPYGYRFARIMESNAGADSAHVGRAILEDWRAFPRDSNVGDDVSILVIASRGSANGSK